MSAVACSANQNEAVTGKSYPSWPVYAEDEIEAVNAVLRSGRVNYWTGDEGRRFETEFAQAMGCQFGVAVANGTVALELALVALGIQPGDEVIVPCRTFIASASAVVMRGAVPVLCDVDPESQNVTSATIEAVLSPRTKAVIVVHLAGWPCDMDPILDLARRRAVKVIEDCAQAHGALYRSHPVGSLGDVGAFSFCQDKIMSTGGEGGMLITNDLRLWERAWSYKDHGKNLEALDRRKPDGGGYRWLHESFGTNWRLTEVQAAIGRAQLRKLGHWLTERRVNARVLTDYFRSLPALRLALPPEYVQHACYKYYAFVKREALKPDWSRDRILAVLLDEGTPVSAGVCGDLSLEQAFHGMGDLPGGRFETGRRLGETSLAFPVHPALTPEDMTRMGKVVKRVLDQASK
jgi:dTDP-4-amino-4,6-dideoxygalactose transaminase